MEIRSPQLAQLEEALVRIPGVTASRVVGEEFPQEIHLVAIPGRPPKQIVRDVQSLAAAHFDIPIDHRIVSIVQLDEDEVEGRPRIPARPTIDQIIVATEGSSGWVKVVLRWPDGTQTEGQAVAAADRKSRIRGATAAAVQALVPKLKERDAKVQLDQLSFVRIGDANTVVVKATYQSDGSKLDLMGSVPVDDDVPSSAVRAVLHALNRKLEA